MLGLLAQGGTVAVDSLYVGLATNTAGTGLDANSTLASVTEPTGGGYARKLLTSANAVVVNNVLDIATPLEWTAVGTAMNGSNWWILCNSSIAASDTGKKLIAYGALSTQPRNLAIGEKLQFDLTWTLSTT